MSHYRKRPVVVEAEQMLISGTVFDYLHSVQIPYEVGDWIITGVKGEKYACKNAVFQATYEPVDVVDPRDADLVALAEALQEIAAPFQKDYGAWTEVARKALRDHAIAIAAARKATGK